MFQQDPLLLGVVMSRAMKKNKQRQVETCRAPGDFRFCRTQHATGYTADTLSDSHTVSHSCVLLMDTSACLYQSFWDDCPSGCSGSVTPESKKKKKKPLCLFCVPLAFCILMWHTLRHSGTTRCGGAGCVGTGMHMQQIAQILVKDFSITSCYISCPLYRFNKNS